MSPGVESVEGNARTAGPLELDSSRRRVAFVVHVMQVAGAEVLVTETVRRLGHAIEPTVFCLDSVGTLGEQLRSEGVDVICLDRRPGLDWGVARRLAREVKRLHVEVVHAHQYTPFFYSALARGLTGNAFRLILTEHGRHYPDVVSPLRRAVNRLVLARQATEINAVCHFSAESLGRVDGFPGRRIAVIENGIQVERYGRPADIASLRAGLGLDSSRRYLTCVARLHPIKDHAMLLRAFARIATSHGDVDLLLAGDGPLRGELEAEANGLGIGSRVKFLGVRRDIPELLAASDVFVLTSVCEAASLTLLEALASGLPVVVTDVGGNPEIVRQGVEGLLVPRGDDSAVAGALGRLLDDPQAAADMGAAGRARALDRYRLETTIDSYHDLYRRLAPRGADR